MYIIKNNYEDKKMRLFDTRHISNTVSFLMIVSFALVSCSKAKVMKEISFAEGFTKEYTSRTPEKEIARHPKDSVIAMVIIDDIICSFNNFRYNNTTPAIKLASLSSPQISKGFFSYGIENGQMALPVFSFSEGKILVYDPMLKKIAVLDAKAASNTEGYEPVFMDTEIMSQRVSPFGERVIFINNFAFEGKEPLVLISDKNWSTKIRTEPFNYMNVMSGSLFSNNVGTRIGCARREIPEMVIFDKKAKPIIKMTFPHDPWEFEKIEYQGITEYIMARSFNEIFYCGCGNDHIFSLVYDDDGDQVLLVFDWEGNILDGFRTEGQIRRVSFSSDEKSIYAWERIDEEDILNEYPLYIAK